jgi:hypothetical protein
LIATSRQPPLRSSRTYDQLPPQADPGVGAVDYHRAYTGSEYRRTRDGQFFLGMVVHDVNPPGTLPCRTVKTQVPASMSTLHEI